METIKEKIKKVSESLKQNKGFLATEEATKNAIIMPFLRALGYDVFNPKEVVPEFTADVGIKKGEKVDYAVFKNDKLIMIIECKQLGVDLNKSYYIDQLYRYFSVTEASVAILTNGEKYMFFSDTEKKNTMDQKPFLVFDMVSAQESTIVELEKFSKHKFDTDSIVSSAVDMKLIREVKEVLDKDIFGQSDQFVSYMIPRVFPNRRRTPQLRRLFKRAVKLASQQIVREHVKGKLESMMTEESNDVPAVEEMAAEQEAYIISGRKRKASKKVSNFILKGNVYEVKNWADLLRTFCTVLFARGPDVSAEKIAYNIPSFSFDSGSLRKPFKIGNTNLFVETNMSASKVRKVCRKLSEVFGYEPEELEITYEEANE